MKAGRTTITGIGREVSYSGEGSNVSVSEFSSAKDVTFNVDLDSKNEMTRVALDTGTTKKVWNSDNANMDEAGGLIFAESKNGQDLIAIAGPEASNFEYQTFGAWLTGYNTGNGSAGAFSVGSETKSANIPASGSARFSGTAGGLYMESGDISPSVALAEATLDADFANRSVSFQTNGTRVGGQGYRPGLDMDGSMSYDAGSNAMKGTVKTVNGMSGTLDGRFYGPSAQEVGGVFATQGNGATFGGGFGAKR